MSKLYQASSSIADFSQMTLSVWFRIPVSVQSSFNAGHFDLGPGNSASDIGAPFGYDGGIELLTFGANDDSWYGSVGLGNISPFKDLDPINSGNPANCIRVFFGYRDTRTDDEVNNHSPVSLIDGYDSLSSAYTTPWVGDGSYVVGHVAFLNSPFTFDQWHHLYLAADIGTGDAGNTQGSFAFKYNLTARHRNIDILFDKVGISGSYLGMLDVLNETSSAGPMDPLPISQHVNGFDFGIPTFNGYSYNPEIKFAELQCWIGSYIATSNIAKFVDSSGKPVDAAVPEAAFGKPTLRFRRNKKLGRAFSTNDGTDGAFSSVGIVSDFSPGP